ncbi:MAG TPA: beta-ketoacyl-ACP reductase [Thermoplasmata archaeon]|nr:beta-ketoacyl-ACP reductase [Thermoplasmata archaeon]
MALSSTIAARASIRTDGHCKYREVQPHPIPMSSPLHRIEVWTGPVHGPAMGEFESQALRCILPVGRLRGRRALVTGAGGGIGREIALELAREGAAVALTYNTNEEGARATSDEIHRMGISSPVVHADVSELGEVEAMKETVTRELGAIDTLVCNAGINRDGLFSRMTEQMWRDVIDVDLTGVFRCVRGFLDEIVASGRGRIVTIASVVGEQGNIGQANYAAAKAGLIGFTKSLAIELAGTGTTVNAVAPGFIETPMLGRVPEKVREKLLVRIPMRRFGTAREVSSCVGFLCTDEAAYVTGNVLDVNGGLRV